MNQQRILWTATSVSLSPSFLDDLKRIGGEVLVENGNSKSPRERIKRLSPQVWVTDVGSPTAHFTRLLKDINTQFPHLSVIVFSSKPTVQEAVDIIRAGAAEYMASRIDPAQLLQVINKCLCQKPVRKGEFRAKDSVSLNQGEIIACDPAMKTLLDLAFKAAVRDATVLVEGESGSGKEVLAKFIHLNSPRKENPFVAINCAALPEHLLESELFGHEKGAFTGAVTRKQGKFELADGGTLLLDEISEMAPTIQAKLLRALQEKQIDRVGGRYPVELDVRVIATTNRDLEKEVRDGNFRLDLYYRLNVVPLRIPPLRARKADIIPLAELFLARQASKYGTSPKELDPDAKAFLESYHWPGNVRELENLMERISIFVESDLVGKQEIESLMRLGPEGSEEVLTDASVLTLKEMEKRMIINALRSHNGNRTRAAKVLGISVRTLRNKLKEYKNEAGL